MLLLLHVHEHDVCRGFRMAGTGERPRRRSDDPSTSDGGVADRDAIVERHKEGIGVPVQEECSSAMVCGA